MPSAKEASSTALHSALSLQPSLERPSSCGHMEGADGAHPRSARRNAAWAPERTGKRLRRSGARAPCLNADADVTKQRRPRR